MKFIHESSLGTIFKIKGIFYFLLMDNEKFDKKNFMMLFNYLLMNYYNFNSRINQILNKDNNKTYHNSINRNNSIEQQVNYDKLLKKKRKY